MVNGFLFNNYFIKKQLNTSKLFTVFHKSGYTNLLKCKDLIHKCNVQNRIFRYNYKILLSLFAVFVS